MRLVICIIDGKVVKRYVDQLKPSYIPKEHSIVKELDRTNIADHNDNSAFSTTGCKCAHEPRKPCCTQYYLLEKPEEFHLTG